MTEEDKENFGTLDTVELDDLMTNFIEEYLGSNGLRSWFNNTIGYLITSAAANEAMIIKNEMKKEE